MSPELRIVQPGSSDAPEQVRIDLDAIAQRVAIAQTHPSLEQRAIAARVLVGDAQLLVRTVMALGQQMIEARELLTSALGRAENSDTIIELILAEQTELRWSKQWVADYQRLGGWELVAEDNDWVLRLRSVDADASVSTLSADEQTQGDQPA